MLTEANQVMEQIITGKALALDATFVLPNSDRVRVTVLWVH